MRLMCKLYGVSPQGYYAWRDRPLSKRAIEDAELLLEIRRVFIQSNQSYGSPRIHRQLKQEGLFVGERRIARIMQENGIRAIPETKNKSKPWKITNYADATNKIVDI